MRILFSTKSQSWLIFKFAPNVIEAWKRLKRILTVRWTNISPQQSQVFRIHTDRSRTRTSTTTKTKVIMNLEEFQLFVNCHESWMAEMEALQSRTHQKEEYIALMEARPAVAVDATDGSLPDSLRNVIEKYLNHCIAYEIPIQVAALTTKGGERLARELFQRTRVMVGLASLTGDEERWRKQKASLDGLIYKSLALNHVPVLQNRLGYTKQEAATFYAHYLRVRSQRELLKTTIKELEEEVKTALKDRNDAVANYLRTLQERARLFQSWDQEHQDLVENETINDNDDVVEIPEGEAYDNKCARDIENGNSEEIKVATVTPATSKEEV